MLFPSFQTKKQKTFLVCGDNMTQKDEKIIREELEKMTLDELLKFIPVVEALGKAKKAGMLFNVAENLQ